jgi:GxxExxY protein
MSQGDQEIRSFGGLTHVIIGAAIEVHRQLGPGLLESAYQACLCAELANSPLVFRREVPLPLRYKGQLLDCGYRMDLVVEPDVLVEIKSVESLQPIHKAQVITYLKLSGLATGLLLNFNVLSLRHGGIRRLRNPNPSPDLLISL